MPNCLDTFAILTGSNAAASRTIFFVPRLIALDWPPIIPPRPNIFFSSVIRQALLGILYFFSSKASKLSPFFDCLIIIFPLILSES